MVFQIKVTEDISGEDALRCASYLPVLLDPQRSGITKEANSSLIATVTSSSARKLECLETGSEFL